MFKEVKKLENFTTFNYQDFFFCFLRGYHSGQKLCDVNSDWIEKEKVDYPLFIYCNFGQTQSVLWRSLH